MPYSVSKPRTLVIIRVRDPSVEFERDGALADLAIQMSFSAQMHVGADSPHHRSRPHHWRFSVTASMVLQVGALTRRAVCPRVFRTRAQ